jgi:hypothetical protein
MPRINEENLPPDLTQALRVWAKQKNIRPVDFSRHMGWGYSHSWAVLKGKQKFSPEAYGKFFLVYGLPALEEVLRIAKIDPKGIVDVQPA